MHDLNELRQRLQTQRPVPWDQLPDITPATMERHRLQHERQPTRKTK